MQKSRWCCSLSNRSQTVGFFTGYDDCRRSFCLFCRAKVGL